MHTGCPLAAAISQPWQAQDARPAKDPGPGGDRQEGPTSHSGTFSEFRLDLSWPMSDSFVTVEFARVELPVGPGASQEVCWSSRAPCNHAVKVRTRGPACAERPEMAAARLVLLQNVHSWSPNAREQARQCGNDVCWRATFLTHSSSIVETCLHRASSDAKTNQRACRLRLPAPPLKSFCPFDMQ